MISTVRLIAIATLVAGCSTGTLPEHFAPAVSPHGVHGTILLKDSKRITVEMLEVRDSSFTVLTRDSIAIVSHSDVARLSLDQIGIKYHMTRPFLDELRLASRYPHGIPEQVMATLLAASGQTAPLVIRSSR